MKMPPGTKTSSKPQKIRHQNLDIHTRFKRQTRLSKETWELGEKVWIGVLVIIFLICVLTLYL